MRIDANGTGIECTVTGEGAPVVLVHGFPDSGRLWRHQVPALAAAGHQVIVPDLRGFGGSDKPAEVDAYGVPFLAGDVIAVMDHLGVERAAMVGHDFGAAVVWALASLLPERVEQMVAMSVGHPASFRSAGLAQRRLSWYTLLFQFEGIAETWLRADGWANFREWSHHPDADDVVADLEPEGALTCALNVYRANIHPRVLVEPPLELPPVAAPAMGLWSSADFALTEEQMTGSAAHLSGTWRYERLEGPGHWMQLEAPDAVNALLVDFLAR